MEWLDRGLIALPKAPGSVFLSWRLLGTDPAAVSFNLYRTTAGGNAEKINKEPISGPTNFVDEGADVTKELTYSVRRY
jgi:rhamnogalacturonan endolyase